MNGWMKVTSLVLGASFGVFLTGCGGGVDDSSTAVAPQMPKEVLEGPQLSAEAGVPIAETSDPTFAETRKLAEESNFVTSRSDKFALLGPEKKFDSEQRNQRVFSQLGSNFMVEWEPPVEKPDPEEQREPQPYRRLAGVLLGDSVMAIIEMESGEPQLVRPGQQIANSEWTVVSIDSEKAVLRRKGNKLPREVVVPLESRRAGAGGGNSGGGDNGAPSGPGSAGVAPEGPGGPPGPPGGPPGGGSGRD